MDTPALPEEGAELSARFKFVSQIKWYVAATNPRKENFAIAHLANQGFGTFFPLIRKVRSKPAGSRGKLAPLFPGYVFVSFCETRHRWQSINGTFGVRRVVGPHGAVPSPIPAAVMADLLGRCPEGIWDPSASAWHRGDKVEVLAGAFAGIPAQFEEMLSRDRVRVLLSWLNSEISAVMPHGFIAAAT